MNTISTAKIRLAGCLFAVSTLGSASDWEPIGQDKPLASYQALCNPPLKVYDRILADTILLGDAAASARLPATSLPAEAASVRLNMIKPLALSLALIHPFDFPVNTLPSHYADIISDPPASLTLTVSLWITITAVMALLFIQRHKSW